MPYVTVGRENSGDINLYYMDWGSGQPIVFSHGWPLSADAFEAFDQIRAGVIADRSQFFKDLTMPFYGFNRTGTKVSEGIRESFWLQGMMAGFPAAYFCIKAFSETDLTEDLKQFDVPTLIMRGDDDQIVPIGASALLASRIVKG